MNHKLLTIAYKLNIDVLDYYIEEFLLLLITLKLDGLNRSFDELLNEINYKRNTA